MYDPTTTTPSPPNYGSSSSSPPPLWSGYNMQYYPGTITWHRGTLWRCEVSHLSDSGSAPDCNLHIWTPVTSTISYGQPPPPVSAQGFQGFSRTYKDKTQHLGLGGTAPHWTSTDPPAPSAVGSSSTKVPIIAPEPVELGSSGPNVLEGELDDDSSPDSQATVTPAAEVSTSRSVLGSKTGHPSYQQGLGMSTAQFFSSKADESMRFLTAKQEAGKARSEDEWKDELKGKRVWRVGGLGIWAHDPEQKAEDAKAAVWRHWGEKGYGREEWLETAKERTSFYTQARGVKPLVTWKLVQPSTAFPFPTDALQIGHEGHQGQPLFSARAWHEGGLHIGKAGPHLNNGCSISYGGGELSLDTFEVLCAKPDPTLLKWICFQHGEKVRVEGWQPVEGGRERDGQSLFVAKGGWEGGEHPGKCRITDDHAHIGWGGGEVWIRPFYVLAYNNAIRR